MCPGQGLAGLHRGRGCRCVGPESLAGGCFACVAPSGARYTPLSLLPLSLLPRLLSEESHVSLSSLAS